MSLVLILCCLWVVAASCVAFLPIKYQIVPGSLLLVLAFGLIIWVGLEHGWIWTGAAVLALVSMFRRPLKALIRKGKILA